MDETGIVAKFHRTDSVICSHSREGKTLSYSQINTVSVGVVQLCKRVYMFFFSV